MFTFFVNLWLIFDRLFIDFWTIIGIFRVALWWSGCGVVVEWARRGGRVVPGTIGPMWGVFVLPVWGVCAAN